MTISPTATTTLPSRVATCPRAGQPIPAALGQPKNPRRKAGLYSRTFRQSAAVDAPFAIMREKPFQERSIASGTETGVPGFLLFELWLYKSILSKTI